MLDRLLIVNADDLGLSPGVTDGIIEGYKRGIVTSTTVLINAPDAQHAVHRVCTEFPSLGLGLHLNLSYGMPAAPPASVPTLVNETGMFSCSSYGDLAHNSAHFDPNQVLLEFKAQLALFVHQAGRLPDHLDSHHHVARIHTNIFAAMLKLAQDHNIPIRNYEATFTPEYIDNKPYINTADMIAIRQLREVYAKYLQVRTPSVYPLGFTFYDTNANKEHLIRILENLPLGISEVMCHPGYGIGLEEAYSDARERELMILTDPEIKATLEDLGIDLVSFSELL